MKSSRRVQITASVGVNLPWNQRMLRIPRGLIRSAALGLWSAANCYSRWHELDGFCPAEALDGYLNVGQMSARNSSGRIADTSETDPTCEVVAWLIEVGLFTDENKDGVHGFRVLRYEEFNELKAEIDARLRKKTKRLLADSERKRISRSEKDVQKMSVRTSVRTSETIPIGQIADVRKMSTDPPGEGEGNGYSSDLGSGTFALIGSPMSTEAQPATSARKGTRRSPEVQEVFDHWAANRKRKHPKGPTPRLDDKRAKVITDRLKDGATVEELKLAVDGIWRSAFHLGQNARETEYTDITIALRDSQHVEELAEKALQAQELAKKEVAQ